MRSGRSGAELCQRGSQGRLQPEVERPVFPAYDLGLQYEVMASIGRHSDPSCPELRVTGTDRFSLLSFGGVQFYLMKRTPGRIPADMPPCRMDGWMVHEDDRRAAGSDVRRRGGYHAGGSPAGLQEPGFSCISKYPAPLPGNSSSPTGTWPHLDWALEGSGRAICAGPPGWLISSQPARARTPPRCAGAIRAWAASFFKGVAGWHRRCTGRGRRPCWENPVAGPGLVQLPGDATFSGGAWAYPGWRGCPSYETRSANGSGSDFSAGDYDYHLVFAGMRYALLLSRIMLPPPARRSELQALWLASYCKRLANGSG